MALLSAPRVDERDWSSLSLGERIRQLEVEGYLVIPGLLDAQHVDRLKAETRTLPTRAVDYSVHQQVASNPQFHGPAMAELSAHAPMLDFLHEVFGPRVVLMSYAFARSEPGHPGISLHADGQPY